MRGPLPDNAVIDQSTGLAFTPGDSPFEKGGLVDKLAMLLALTIWSTNS
ncbi:hypothetical protein [Escherichia coli]|nr:hypothetical protein [Escherichia coli]AWF23687.1 sit domain protein [Escherichia coli]